MPSIRFLVLSLAVGLCAFGAQAKPAKAKPEASGILITGVTVISPEREAPMANAWVAIRDGRVVTLGQGKAPESTADLEHKDAAGKFLIPGLIDAHVHLESVPGMAFPQKQANPKLVKAYRKQLPRSYLFHGFTTVIDLAPGDPRVLKEIAQSPAAPDIYSCSSPLPLANGYPMVFLPEAVRFRLNPNFLYDSRQKDSIPKKFRPQNHSPEAAVGRAVEAGGICVKTFVEDGFGLQKIWPVPTVDMLSQVKVATQKHGVPMMVHANSFDAYHLALDGGADILVHGLWAWDQHQSSDTGEGLPKPVRDLAQRVATSGTAFMPTLQVLAGDRALFDDTFLQDPRLGDVLPGSLLAWFRSREGAWFKKDLIAGLPPEQQTAEAAYEIHSRALSRVERVTAFLAQQPGRLLFGSDTPSGPSYGNPPGYNGFLEMRRLAAAGISLPRLFIAATLENARAFGLDDRFGSISAGKVANLLLLDQNPLESVEAYDTISSIVLRGDWLERKSLTAPSRDSSP